MKTKRRIERKTQKRFILLRQCFHTKPLALATIYLTLTASIKATTIGFMIFLLQSFVENSFGPQIPQDYLRVILLFLGLAFVYLFGDFFFEIFFKILKDALAYEITIDFLKSSLQKEIDNRSNLNQLQKKVLEDIEVLINGFFYPILLTVAIGIPLFYLSPLAVAVFLVGAILISFFTTDFLLDRQEALDRTVVSQSDAENELIGVLLKPKAVMELQIYNASTLFLQRWRLLSRAAFREKELRDSNANFADGLKNITAIVTYLVALTVVGYFFLRNEVTLGTVIVTGLFGRVFIDRMTRVFESLFKIELQDSYYVDLL